MKAILQLSQGDMRKSLNILQSTHMAFGSVTENNVYTCLGHPLKSDVNDIMNWLLNEKFTDIYKNIQELQINKGLALQDILTEVHLFVHRIDFPVDIKLNILEKMAGIERNINNGASEKLNLSALVACFQPARNLPSQESN